MTSPVAILDYAVYAPARRLTRDVWADLGWQAPSGVTAIAAGYADEDALTMAIEAMRLLQPPATIGSVGLASTSLPYTQKVQAGLLAEYLGQSDLLTTEHTTSARAVSEAMVLHCGLVASGHGDAVVVGSEASDPARRPPGRAPSGAAAAAVSVGAHPGVAQVVSWSHAVAEAPGLDARLRLDDAPVDVDVADYAADAIRELAADAIGTALRRASLHAEDVDSAVMGIASRRLAAAAAAAGGLRAAQWQSVWPYRDLGDIGCAGPLVGLASALEHSQPGSHVLLLTHGGGSAVDALVLTAGPDPRRGSRAVQGVAARSLDVASAVRLFEGV